MKKLLVFLLILLGFGATESLATLKLTFPNGWEYLVIGSDTLITWEGIAVTDTVTLEYSIDNGVTWSLITDKATGLKYLWKKIPVPQSYDCYLRIKQNGYIDPSDTEPAIHWQKTYGGSDFDHAWCIKQTKEGGYIVAGSTISSDGDITENKGDVDAWVLKLNKLGNIEWQRTYGSSRGDGTTSILQTSDGGYLFAGSASSIDGDVSSRDSCLGFWIVKLDPLGKIEWDKSFCDSGWNVAFDFQQTADGGFIATGYYYYGMGYWVIKIDKFGNQEWEKIYMKEKNSWARSIRQTTDGGYIIAGYTKQPDPGYPDYWIIKIDDSGNIEWDKTYGGIDSDMASSILQTVDGGYIVAGSTRSNWGEVTENHGMVDYWILKLDAAGNIEWKKTFGGSKSENPNSIIKTIDGGYIIAGGAESNDGDVIGNKGFYDGWLLKIDSFGNVEWQKPIGGSSGESFSSIQQTTDEGYVMAGDSYSDDITGCANKGKTDFYIVKIGPKLQNDISDKPFSIVAPKVQATDIDMKDCILGNVKDSTLANFVSNPGKYKYRVDSIYLSGADKDAFKLLSPLPKYNLLPGEKKATKIEFTPNRLGVHSASINIITQTDTLIRSIQGRGIVKLGVGINNDSAYAGEIKRLKLVMSILKPEVLATYATNFEAKIRFQKTILTPLKKVDRNVVKDSIYMSVNGVIGTSYELAQIFVVAGLGNVEETTIDIVEFTLLDNNGNKVDFDIETQSGLLKLLGICSEGGTRLINPNGKAEILSIIPNPASDDVEIKVYLIEDGISTLSLFNSNGVKLEEVILNDGVGMKTVHLDLKKYDSGLYFIKLQTPTVVENQKLVIIK